MNFDWAGLTGLTATRDEVEKAKKRDILQMQIDIDNGKKGNLKFYDCPVCRNKGVVFIKKDGMEIAADCECMPLRKMNETLEKSGISPALQKMSFDNYACSGEWQERIKQAAISFLNAPPGSFFFAGGQCGAGKTHICTALLKGFLKNNKSILYFRWADDLQKVLSLSGNESRAERNNTVEPLKKTDVLYIDDFLRSKPPSQAEIKLAFEIINTRYAGGLTTVISSEKTIGEIKKTDEAIYSRILERTEKEKYCFNIAHNPELNHRLK